MCKASERPQRRHRAMYFAPTARPIHPQLVVPDSADPVLPLIMVAPTPTQEVATPPPTDPLAAVVDSEHPRNTSMSLRRLPSMLWTVYHWFVDLFLLVIVCFMGCFFYDVEVKVVKSDRRQAMARGRSGRVVIRTDSPGLPALASRNSPRRHRTSAPRSATRMTQLSQPSSNRSRNEVIPV